LKRIKIAIDGPSASGKSTTARIVAERLGYLYIDTGAMYRAIALKVLQGGFDVEDEGNISKLVEETQVTLRQERGELKVYLDGRDVTRELREPVVSNAASAVSVIPKVREALVREQRIMGRGGGIVVEGRDVGTVVFPDAELKIFMVADERGRALRRQREHSLTGTYVELELLMKEMQERDMRDSTRSISPLRKADDAIELDTSDLTVEQQVEFVLKEAAKRIGSS
jgi:cytidylate kinase